MSKKVPNYICSKVQKVEKNVNEISTTVEEIEKWLIKQGIDIYKDKQIEKEIISLKVGILTATTFINIVEKKLKEKEKNC